ncbi:hypothetical protein ACFQ60_00120 [Streptomyces zhihengii]
MIDGLLHRCRAAGAAIRARVDPVVDTALAAVDVAAVVFTVRGKFARRHVLAEARRHLLETLRGREFTRGLDDYTADRALSDHSRQTTDPQPGRRAPAADQIFYTADFPEPDPWFIAGTGGKPPGVVPLREGPGCQPCRTGRDPHRPHRSRRAGRRPGRHVDCRAYGRPAPRPGVSPTARRRPPRPGRRPHPGAAGRRHPRPSAGRYA